MSKLFATLGVLAAVVTTAGCDPRGAFIATYNGTDQSALTSGGLTTTTYSMNGVEISDSVTASGKILIPIGPAGCTFPATVSSSTAFSVDPASTCTAPVSDGSTLTWTVTTGNGTLNTNNLSYSVSTNVVQTGNGTTNNGTQVDTVTLTRQ